MFGIIHCVLVIVLLFLRGDYSILRGRRGRVRNIGESRDID
jgi:hypothetical protein